MTIEIERTIRSCWCRWIARAICAVRLSMSIASATDFPIPVVADSGTGSPQWESPNALTGGQSVVRYDSPFFQPPSLHLAATTTNQFQVGTALDNISSTSTGSLSSMINTLGTQTVAEQRQSLQQLGGEMFGNTQTLGLQVGDQFQQRLTNRLVSNGSFLAGDSVTQVNLSWVRGQSPTSSSAPWVQGYVAGSSVRSDGNAGAMSYNQGGALYGWDIASDEAGVFGVTGGNSYVGFNDGSGGGQLTSYQVGLYALKHNEYAYALGSANYGYDVFGTNRNVDVGGINQTLRGSFDGHQFGSYLESGLKLEARWIHVQPLVGLQYLYLAQQGFGESGGSAALNVAARQADSLRASLGGRIVVHRLTGPWGAVWTPYWQGRLVSELLDNDRIVNASFNGSPIGGTFTSHGNQIGRNYGIFGKGLQVQLNDQWSLFGNYDAFFGGRITTSTFAAGAVYNW